MWTCKFKLIVTDVEIHNKISFYELLMNLNYPWPTLLEIPNQIYTAILILIWLFFRHVLIPKGRNLSKLTSHWLFSLVDVMSNCWYCSLSFENSASNLVCSSLELFRRLFKFLWSVCKTSVSFTSWLYVWFNL